MVKSLKPDRKRLEDILQLYSVSLLYNSLRVTRLTKVFSGSVILLLNVSRENTT